MPHQRHLLRHQQIFQKTQKGILMLLTRPQSQPKVCHSQQHGQVLHVSALHNSMTCTMSACRSAQTNKPAPIPVIAGTGGMHASVLLCSGQGKDGGHCGRSCCSLACDARSEGEGCCGCCSCCKPPIVHHSYETATRDEERHLPQCTSEPLP